MRKWTSIISGWIFGAVMAVFVITPFVAEWLHREIPVYTVYPASFTVTCSSEAVIFAGEALKKEPFQVLDHGGIGRLEITWNFEGFNQVNTVPLLAPNGDFVPTRPIITTGQEFVVGPFMFPRHMDGELQSVSVKLPGYRFGFHRTTAEIGPIFLPPCDQPL